MTEAEFAARHAEFDKKFAETNAIIEAARKEIDEGDQCVTNLIALRTIDMELMEIRRQNEEQFAAFQHRVAEYNRLDAERFMREVSAWNQHAA